MPANFVAWFSMPTPLSVNFTFLQQHDPSLLQAAAWAEKYVFEDPNTALFKIRQLAELLAKGVLNSPFIFLDHVQRKIQGAASPVINVGEVKRFPVPVVPEEVQSLLANLIRNGLESVQRITELQTNSKADLTQRNQSILAKAFRGELVPQDSGDEPASELLARIRSTRKAAVQKQTKNTQEKAVKK